MKPSLRVFLAGVVVELLLAGLGYFLLAQLAVGRLTPATTAADAAATVTSVLGAVMGGLAGIVAVVYIVLKRKGS